jgi:hypothetical protein
MSETIAVFKSARSLRMLTAELLVSGGDERLRLNAQGVNKYGCPPTPNDAILSFSSSTASIISDENFRSLEQYIARLQNEIKETDELTLYEREKTRQKNEWLSLLQCPNNTQLLFSPSGTDSHALIAAQLPEKTFIIMAEGNETGSGVAQALTRGNNDVEVVSIALRLSNSTPRCIDQCDAQVIEYVEKGIEQGRHVFLIVVDQSKTGMIAPSPACAMQLKTRLGEKLTVLVDACQFRMSAQTLHAYLAQGFMVATTGSKFLSAPSFSAMIFLPEKTNVQSPNMTVNWGLISRMEVALMQYREFCGLSNAKICSIIADFTQVISHYIERSTTFAVLPVNALKRDGLLDLATWDAMPTIFPFILYKNQKPLSRAQTLVCYHQLPLQEIPCQIGQPVVCGEIEGVEVSALRFCLSSRIIVQATQSAYHHNQLIYNTLRVFASIEKLVESDLI